MTWHYCICRYDHDGNTVYDVREVYHDIPGIAEPVCTDEAIRVIGDSREDIIHQLEMMLSDAKHHRTFDIDLREVVDDPR